MRSWRSRSAAQPNRRRALRALLLPRDPNARAGRDPGDPRRHRRRRGVRSLARICCACICAMRERHGYRVEYLSSNLTDMGGVKEVVLSLGGRRGAYSRLKYESGVHRVQRVPETESQGRIHTSAATVAVLPEVDDVQVELRDCDLAHRYLPRQRRGRPAREQDRVRHPHHASAHGHRRAVSGRKIADQEPRTGHARAQKPPV